MHELEDDMRVLVEADLRWVSGGFCTCNENPDPNDDHFSDYNYTLSEIDSLRSIWEAAIAAENDAQEHLALQTPNTPAWTSANAAYDAAINAEIAAAEAFFYADAHWCLNGEL